MVGNGRNGRTGAMFSTKATFSRTGEDKASFFSLRLKEEVIAPVAPVKRFNRNRIIFLRGINVAPVIAPVIAPVAPVIRISP
jgi:hypothetical protein